LEIKELLSPDLEAQVPEESKIDVLVKEEMTDPEIMW